MTELMTPPDRLRIESWRIDELYVSVKHVGGSEDGCYRWVPVDAADDGDVCWVKGRRFCAETGHPKPPQ